MLIFKRKKYLIFPWVVVFSLAGLLSFASHLYSQKVDYSQKPVQSERSRTFDALHYLIQLYLDIEEKYFEGQTTITLSSLRESLPTIVLDAEDFKVTKILNEWGESLSFTQENRKLIVNLLRPYKFGEVISITVFYRSLDECHRSSEPKKGLRFYEATDEHPALVASDSWPDGVHHWFPCYDYPNDKVTNEVIATVKEPNKVASNGRLVRVVHHKEKGTVTYHWLQDKPHSTYLIFLAAGPYEVLRDSYQNIPINYWVFPQHVKDAWRSYQKTPKMMEFFIKKFDTPYPWDKYDQISVPFGGGAESTSATAMTYRIIHDEKADQDWPSIGIVSHELAHQWWGDLITLRSWAHAWLNESFGTYSDYLYYEYDRGPEEGAINLLNKKNAYLREAHTEYIRPIVTNHYERPQDLFDAHSYPKGACVLHMLRFVLGDNSFFLVLKEFLHRYSFQPVETHDFTKTVKDVTGRNLDWFFREWLFKPGHPVFKVNYRWEEKQGILNLVIEQIQDTSLGIPIFKMPVLVGIRVKEDGAKNQSEINLYDQTREAHRIELVKVEKVHGQIEYIFKLWINEAKEIYEIPLKNQPLMVRFDRGNYLLKEWEFPKSRKELLYQAQFDDVIGRMWAVKQLEQFKEEPEVEEAVLRIARNDSFWAVRKAAVEVIGSWKKSRFIPFFKEKCLDVHSQVRAAAFKSLSEFRQPELVSFVKERFQKETSYLAQAEALRALGKIAGSGQVEFLKEAAKMPSYRDVIRRAALEALEAITKKNK